MPVIEKKGLYTQPAQPARPEVVCDHFNLRYIRQLEIKPDGAVEAFITPRPCDPEGNIVELPEDVEMSHIKVFIPADKAKPLLASVLQVIADQAGRDSELN